MLITSIVLLLLVIALFVAFLFNQDDLVNTLYTCIGEVIGFENGAA
jgi:hypothetical protein